jgi:hypothetical protein
VPSQPNPSDPPPPPGPISYKVVAGPATIENGEVSFDLTGDPQLPPTLSLNLQSAPAGITFGSNGTCEVRVGDATVADCNTTPLTALATMPFARTMLAEAIQSFKITMPLAGTPVEDTLVTVILRDDKGEELARTDGRYITEPAPSSDIALALDSSTPVTAGKDGAYVVSGSITGIPAGTPAVVLTLSGDATLAASSAGPCALDVKSVVCTPETGATEIPFSLTLNTADNDQDRKVSLEITSPVGYSGDTAGNNVSGEIVLKATPDDGDLRFGSGPTATLQANNDYVVSATVAGIPLGTKQVTFSSPDNKQVRFKLPVFPVCAISEEREMVCPVPDGASELSVQFSAQLPAGKGTLTVTVDGQPSVSQAIAMPGPAGANLTSARTIQEAIDSSTSAGNLAPSLAGGGAGLPTGDLVTVERAPDTMNQLLSPGGQHTSKADAAHEAKRAQKQAASKSPQRAKDQGKGKSGVGSPAVAGTAPPASASSGSNSNDKGPGNGQGNGKKDEPSPVEQVVDALISLLP